MDCRSRHRQLDLHRQLDVYHQLDLNQAKAAPRNGCNCCTLQSLWILA